MLKLFGVADKRRRPLIIYHVHSFYFFNLLTQAIGKHCHSLQSIVLSQCGSLSSKGISTLVSKCRQLKMLDVAMTKVILIHNKQKICNASRNEFSCVRQFSLSFTQRFSQVCPQHFLHQFSIYLWQLPISIVQFKHRSVHYRATFRRISHVILFSLNCCANLCNKMASLKTLRYRMSQEVSRCRAEINRFALG